MPAWLWNKDVSGSHRFVLFVLPRIMSPLTQICADGKWSQQYFPLSFSMMVLSFRWFSGKKNQHTRPVTVFKRVYARTLYSRNSWRRKNKNGGSVGTPDCPSILNDTIRNTCVKTTIWTLKESNHFERTACSRWPTFLKRTVSGISV